MKHKSSVVIVFAIMLIILCSYFFPQLKQSSSENRTMATFKMVLHPEKDSLVYHESPVERLEAALSDQFPFRETVVKQYLKFFNTSENLTYSVVRPFLGKGEDQYVLHAIGSYEEIEDTGYITLFPDTAPLEPAIVEKRVEQIEKIHTEYPDVKIYTYYVTQAYDMPWFDDYIGMKVADHYKEISDAIPDYVNGGKLVYEDLDDYMNIHYKTDHHMNHRGADRCYRDIYGMMSRDMELGPMRKILSENDMSREYGIAYRGSYGQALGKLYDGYDDFSFYTYDLPGRETAVIDPSTMKEIPVERIGLYDDYLKGEFSKNPDADHYILMYGTAVGKDGKTYDDNAFPYVIRNSRGNGKNLLITGDSYDRVIRDPLASHFDTTVYLDYRLLSSVPIDTIIETYDIDVVLISSHTRMWNSEEYLFTFGED